jgi:flavin-binding protein dodecin
MASGMDRSYCPIPVPVSGDRRPPTEDPMDHTYKITEIVGSSSEGIDAAIRNGIARASKTLRNLDWFEVTDVRGAMNEGDIAWFQVTMKVGFRLEDGE